MRKTKTKRGEDVTSAVKRLLRKQRPEALAVALNVTVYTVYRWASGKTAAHRRHAEAIRALVKKGGK